jgi:hypothetical protein
MQNNAAAAAADGSSSSSSALTSMMLPPKFVHDPGTYLAEVASMPPSRQTMAALAGPVAGWFTANSSNNGPETTSFSDARGVASVYLQAASVQLKDTEVKVGDVEQEMIRTKQQYEILEVRKREHTIITLYFLNEWQNIHNSDKTRCFVGSLLFGSHPLPLYDYCFLYRRLSAPPPPCPLAWAFPVRRFCPPSPKS